MRADPSQDSLLREILHDEEEEDFTVDEVEQGNVVALARALLDGQVLESPPLSGPLNPWRHSGRRTQSPHKDMTILLRTEDPLGLMARHFWMGLLRVVEKDHGGPDQQGPPGKINPPALGA